MRKNITTVYLFLLSAILSIAFTFRWYRVWSFVYSRIYIPRIILRGVRLPLLHPNPKDALTIALKQDYNPDGIKELWDVCADPRLFEFKVQNTLFEEGNLRKESVDVFRDQVTKTVPTSNDCDDYARYLANSIDPVWSPYIVSVICYDKREMKWDMIPKIKGHAVCLFIDINKGTMSHIGNWNSKENVDPYQFEYSNFRELVEDLTYHMSDNKFQTVAWLVMDPDLRTCAWGMGQAPNDTVFDFILKKPTSIIG